MLFIEKKNEILCREEEKFECSMPHLISLANISVKSASLREKNDFFNHLETSIDRSASFEISTTRISGFKFVSHFSNPFRLWLFGLCFLGCCCCFLFVLVFSGSVLLWDILCTVFLVD